MRHTGLQNRAVAVGSVVRNVETVSGFAAKDLRKEADLSCTDCCRLSSIADVACRFLIRRDAGAVLRRWNQLPKQIRDSVNTLVDGFLATELRNEAPRNLFRRHNGVDEILLNGGESRRVVHGPCICLSSPSATKAARRFYRRHIFPRPQCLRGLQPHCAFGFHLFCP